MVSRPESISAWRRAAASSMRILGSPVSMALAMPPSAFDFLNVLPGLVHQFVGQALHIVAAGPRVHHLGDAGLFLQVDLRVAGDARRKIGGQRDGLVERVGVQRLRVSQDRGHRFHAVRGTLLKTSCAARLQPEVWQCVRSAIDFWDSWDESP